MQKTQVIFRHVSNKSPGDKLLMLLIMLMRRRLGSDLVMNLRHAKIKGGGTRTM